MALLAADSADRPVRAAVPDAALAIYLPQVLPFLVGPLTECSHCIGTYLKLFAILPGGLPGILIGGGGPVTWLIGGVTTLVALTVATLMMQTVRAHGLRLLLGATIAAVSAANALSIAQALRS